MNSAIQCSECKWVVYRWQNIIKLGWTWRNGFKCPTHPIKQSKGEEKMSDKFAKDSVSESHIAPLEPELLPLVEQTLAALKPLVDYIDLPWYKKLFKKTPIIKQSKEED